MVDDTSNRDTNSWSSEYTTYHSTQIYISKTTQYEPVNQNTHFL